jgi:hypothetical protein
MKLRTDLTLYNSRVNEFTTDYHRRHFSAQNRHTGRGFVSGDSFLILIKLGQPNAVVNDSTVLLNWSEHIKAQATRLLLFARLGMCAHKLLKGLLLAGLEVKLYDDRDL